MAAPAVAGRRTASITTALILTLALQSAVPPFATDMYTPAFPRVTVDLQTEASLVGLTMTTFFSGWRSVSCSVDRSPTSAGDERR